MAALPTTATPADIEISSWSPTLISRAHSLATQRRSRGGQRWKVSFGYAGLQRASYLELWAFLNAQRGQYGTFTLTLPTAIVPRGSWGGTPLVNGAHSAGDSTIVTDGHTINITGAGKRGDFIKFAGHSKVYQVTDDFNSDGSGNATISIMPELLASLANDEAISFSAVPFTVILEDDELALSLRPPALGVLSFSAIEEY